MPDVRSFAEITRDDIGLVGGKGLSLGLMAAVGLPVPPGFCITTKAYRQANGVLGEPLMNAVRNAYDKLGGGLVAVRSSATDEDGSETSFAGQQETILGVEGEPALRYAIERCWESLHTERAKAYRRKQGIDDTGMAMALVVQKLVEADVAGVLFTRDPSDPSEETMLVEASWGLGEAVVSGKVTPDSFCVAFKTSEVRDRKLGRKTVRITSKGTEEVPAGQQNEFCLTDAQLAELAELGRKVEEFYGGPRDIEWAIADGRCWLLQARPITTISAADRERVRRSEIERLKSLAAPGGTVWARYNLIEILPAPTPMTWGVVECLLSGGGGSGLMYRDLGLTPSPIMDRQTVYDLVGGRPYANLSREPYMQAKRPQSDYPFEKYRENPLLALDPQPDPNSMFRGWGRKLRLPWFIWKQMAFARRVAKTSGTFAKEFREKSVPAFVSDVEEAEGDRFSKLDAGALMQRFEHWVQRTLVKFAKDSLKPTLFAQFEMQVLEQQLRKPLGPERAKAAVAELAGGARTDPEADFAQGIREVLRGTKTRAEFLKQFGHRGPQEMELSAPRWAEDSTSLEQMLNAGRGESPVASEPLAEKWARVATEAKLAPFVAKWLGNHAERLHVYLGLRETAKHYLMRGYFLVRRAVVELDRRFRLNGGTFFLTPEELPRLVAGEDLKSLIEERKRMRQIALSLEVPPVFFSDDLEAIGRPLPAPAAAMEFDGTPLSAGVAEGPALVLESPPSEAPPAGYILVCPSTDPAWVPLFVHAKGLVMESGGALSHGAIVAREFGLPAVAGIPDVHRRIKSGQKIRVDGSRGVVSIIS